MKYFIKKIIIADMVILVAQAMLLLIFLHCEQSDDYNCKILTHIIFTMNENIILFINLPIIIFIYYMYLYIRHEISGVTFKYSLPGLLNFIFLYLISWIEMLALVSLKFKG